MATRMGEAQKDRGLRHLALARAELAAAKKRLPDETRVRTRPVLNRLGDIVDVPEALIEHALLPTGSDGDAPLPYNT